MNTSMELYIAAKRVVDSNYKLMDEALAQAVKELTGIETPQLISYTDPDTGDRWAINITARANPIERGKPRDDS